MAALKLLWARHGHDHDSIAMDMDMDMDMGTDTDLINDDMNVGTIDVLWFPKLYWVFIGAVIAAFTVVNLLNVLQSRQRLAARSRTQHSPARPRNFSTKTYATLTAVSREISNASVSSFRFGGVNYVQPTVGKLSLVLGHTVLILVLCFYALHPTRNSDAQNTAYRAGFLSLGQLPLIYLLAGKNNIIGWLTGSSYERLNWLHRWVSRTLLLTVTLHLAFWFKNWAPHNYIGHALRENDIVQRGFIAWIILIWIVFSSFAPIRRWSYEIFVLQHVVSMIALMVMLFLHLPSDDYGWLYASVAVYLLDRLVRAGYAAYLNLAIFHPRQKDAGTMRGFWSCRAELSLMEQGVTKVTIHDPPMTWKAGQHAFISFHSIVPLQSHPFTISSLPSDNKLEFFVKARKGATRRLLEHAAKLELPSAERQALPAVAVAIEGPYGRMRSLPQFDSIVLIAGSTGATFTMPLLRDLLSRWKTSSCCEKKGNLWATPAGSVTRHVRFNWVVKSQEQLFWFAEELRNVIEDVNTLQKQGNSNIILEVHAYVTCDETLTADFAEKPPLPRPEGTTRVMSIASSEVSRHLLIHLEPLLSWDSRSLCSC